MVGKRSVDNHWRGGWKRKRYLKTWTGMAHVAINVSVAPLVVIRALCDTLLPPKPAAAIIQMLYSHKRKAEHTSQAPALCRISRVHRTFHSTQFIPQYVNTSHIRHVPTNYISSS